LKWENVDFNHNSIRICEVFVAGKFKNKTKTEETRVVPMLPQLQHRMKLWHMTWQYPSNGLVFPNQAGNNPININDISAASSSLRLSESASTIMGYTLADGGSEPCSLRRGATLEETSVAMGNSPSVVFAHYFKKQNSKLAVSGVAKLKASMLGSGVLDTRKFSNTPLMLPTGRDCEQ
jgi:hypothetical protein